MGGEGYPGDREAFATPRQVEGPEIRFDGLHPNPETTLPSGYISCPFDLHRAFHPHALEHSKKSMLCVKSGGGEILENAAQDSKGTGRVREDCCR